MKRIWVIAIASTMFAGAAHAGSPRGYSVGDGVVVPVTKCTVRVSASGLTVGDDYAFVLTANGSNEVVTYTVQVKADDESYRSRDFRVDMAEGTTLALSGRNLSNAAAPEFASAVNEGCSGPASASGRSPRG